MAATAAGRICSLTPLLLAGCAVSPAEHEAVQQSAVVYGTARIVPDDEPVLDRVRAAFAEHHFGDPSKDFRRRTHVWFEVTPYRRTSWDFGRIPAGTDRFA